MGIKLQQIFGAVLVALIVVMGARLLGGSLVPEKTLEEPAIQVAGADNGEPAAGAPEPKQETPFPVLLAAATPEDGQKVAKKCTSCHGFDEGGKHKVGPNLHGIVGADKAAKDGFAYSPVLTEMPGEWGYDELNAFLTKPTDYAPGTKMSFAGLKKPEDRAAVIAYLRSVSPNAPALPEVAAAEEAAPEAAPEAEMAPEGEGEAAPAAAE